MVITVFNIYNSSVMDLAQLFLISVKKQRFSLTEAVVIMLACRGRFSCTKPHLQEHSAVHLCVKVTVRSTVVKDSAFCSKSSAEPNPGLTLTELLLQS